jgi:uncharacterized protein Yka (UPF0111/DUF47 family)
MRPLPRRAYDPEVIALLAEAGGNVKRAATLLRDLLEAYPEHGELPQALRDCEHEGDRITHDLIHRLNRGSGGRRAPFEPADGHALVTALDDIVDYAEQAADSMVLHRIEAPMEQALELTEVLCGATEHVAAALHALCAGADLREHLVEIRRHEHEGDRLNRDAVASLFMTGIDPMVVLRWKDVFESLEASVDSCEKVAHVLEGIALKRRR